MKKIYYSLGFLLMLALSNNLQAQCTLNTFATDVNITCGECTTLSAFGNGAGNVAFQENFNSGSPVGWQFTQTVTIAANTCNTPSPDGTPFMWMGSASVNPRDMTTVPFNLTLGGTICFEMRYSIQGGNSPCEGPDEPQEGVYLQYSTNGTTWTTIQYWDPDGGNSSSLTTWRQYCAILPPGALTTTTQIRWHQDNVSGAEYDHWGIDNVKITLNDPNYTITWLHDNYSYGMGSPGGNNPTPVCPHATTTYQAQITNGTTTCNSSITVNVAMPTLVFDLGNDTSACPGECVTLHSNAYELVSPASTPTFANNQVGVITGTPQSPITIPCLFGTCNCWNGTTVTAGNSCPPQPGSINSSMNINVQNLNATTITSGSITGVCIKSFNITPGFGCNSTSLATIKITLVCPSGTEVVLVPAGTLTGTSINNMCFNLGAAPYTGASSPYTGTFAPANSWAALNGCTANGVWILKLSGANNETCIPVGQIGGWSISFDDPAITAPVNFTWSPTTNMTNETTLSPTICPTATTTYTLTASDTDGCATQSDNIVVAVAPCCLLEIDNVPTVNPDCNASNGQITIQYSGQTTGLQFSIDGGTTYQTSNVFPNLAAGTYNIKIIDDANCPVTQQVTLTNPNAPTLTVTKTDPTCGNNDGTITVVAAGGTAPFDYSINNGTTTQATGSFTGLAVGSYQVLVTDDNNCQATQTVTLSNISGPAISNVVPTNPDCNASNGSVVVTATGTGTLSYSIDGGTAQALATFNGLSAGSHSVLVTDGNGCTTTQTVLLTANAGPAISAVNETDSDCGASNGTISVVATGTGTLGYTANSGTSQTSPTFNGLDAGSYVIVVTDANGCTATQTVQITEGSGPSITAVNTTPPTCGASDGAINIVATGGTAPLDYSINNGTTTQVTPGFNNLAAGTYNIVVSDANGCEATQQVLLNSSSVPNVNAGADITICAGEPVTLTATGATTYVWSGGITNGVAFNPTVTTTYTVTGTDAAGCVNTDVVTVTVVPIPTANFTADVTAGNPVLNVVFTNTSTGATGFIWDFNNGTPPLTTGSGNQNGSFSNPGVYTVTLTASNGNCTDIFSMPITVLGYPPFEIHIPNVFTPNGDHANDEFFIDVKNGQSIEVHIFNRWGNKMFEMKDFNTKWNGNDATEGVYFFTYIITGLDGEKREGQGNVTLVRK